MIKFVQLLVVFFSIHVLAMEGGSVKDGGILHGQNGTTETIYLDKNEESITRQFNEDEKLKVIKREVESVFKLIPDTFVLVRNNDFLIDEEKTLKDYGINKGDHIQILVLSNAQ